MKNILTLFIITLLFSACGADKEPLTTTPKPLPSWYVHPPQSDTGYLYEVAEGHDKKEAITHALEMMAATLSTTISSNYKSTTTTSSGVNNSYQQDVSHEVETSVNAIRISNYNVVESTQQSFRRYLVLIKSDKKVLFESLKHELDETALQLQEEEKHIKDKNVLAQLMFYKRAQQEYNTLQQTLNVMHVLNTNFDAKPYIQQAQHYHNSCDRLRTHVTFSFQNSINTKNLVPVLSSGLSKEGIKIKASEGPYHLTIRIDADIEEVKSMGFDLARAAISIQVLDHTQSVLGSNKLNITGQSTQGYRVARENVAIKLKRLVDEKGIQTILGVNF